MSFDKAKYLNLSIKGVNLFVFCFHLHLAYQINMEGYFLAVEPELRNIVASSKATRKAVRIKRGLRTGYKTQTRYKMWTRNYGLSIKHGLGIKCRLWTVYIKTSR